MVQYGKKFSIGIIRCTDDGTGFFIDRLFLWCLSQKHAGPSAGDPDMKDDGKQNRSVIKRAKMSHAPYDVGVMLDLF